MPAVALVLVEHPGLPTLQAESYNFCGCAPAPSAAATEWEGNGGGEGGASPQIVAVPDIDAQLVVLWDLRQLRHC